MDNISGVLHNIEKTKSHTGSDSLLIDSRDHLRVLDTCVDIPESMPDFPLKINSVGICNKTIWVLLPEGRIPFSAEIHVDLPPGLKGIHMSRMEGSISKLHDIPFSDIGEYTEKLAEEILENQEGAKSTVRLSGKMPLIQRTPASQKTSVDTIDASSQTSCETGRNDSRHLKTVISAAVNHITACPCTQEYNRILYRSDSDIPLPTHSQRSTTRLAVERKNGFPLFSDLVSCLTSALHATCDLLKRPDEAEIVLKAHKSPQFAEDTARQTARQAGVDFSALLPPETFIEIESISLESIHTHDVHCKITTSLMAIMSVLEKLES